MVEFFRVITLINYQYKFYGMSQFQSESVTDFIQEVNTTRFIPYIQRDFVWNEKQIIRLFDSIMCDYPIGSFLIWRVDTDKSGPAIYKFPKNYITDYTHPLDRGEYEHRPEISESISSNKVSLVLDGQQRITSLYMGLVGTLTNKKSGYHWYREENWTKKEICVNLLSAKDTTPSSDLAYDIDFKDSGDIPKNDDEYWYPFSRILEVEDRWEEIARLEEENQISDEDFSTVRAVLKEVYTQFDKKLVMNYYQYTGDSLDDMIEMFVRTNKGGVKLSKSDMLLSILTEFWSRKDIDSVARKEINDFQEELSNTFNTSKIDTKFILRNILYCSDSNIRFNLDNFTSNNIESMFEVWNDGAYTRSLKTALNFLKTYNLRIDEISLTIFHCVVYYFYKSGIQKFHRTSKSHSEIQKDLLRFICTAGIRESMNESTSQKLLAVRKALQDSELDREFPFSAILKQIRTYTPIDITPSVYGEIIKSISYPSSKVKLFLTLLYIENIQYIRDSETLHIDHIYPKSTLENVKTTSIHIDDPINTVLNLQYLTETENESKSDSGYEEWIQDRTEDYRKKSHIPQLDPDDTTYSEFIRRRNNLIKDTLITTKGDNNGI